MWYYLPGYSYAHSSHLNVPKDEAPKKDTTEEEEEKK